MPQLAKVQAKVATAVGHGSLVLVAGEPGIGKVGMYAVFRKDHGAGHTASDPPS